MAAGWLNHNALQLIKGIGKTPGDTNSAENDPVVVNLLSGLITLTQDGWSPNIPAIKSGGVWVDSPITDGRQLLAASAGNVIEKISVTVADTSARGVARMLIGLNKMAADCRDFWQTQGQIDPVYLMWYPSCGAGPQYALLYNIDLTPSYLDSPTPAMRVDLSLEREPYWRPIPPGANPLMWTFAINPSHPQFNASVAALNTANDLIVDTTLKNRHEFSPTDYLTVVSRNYVDIPATSIPGDAPALVQLTAMIDTGVATHSARNIYLWRSTRPTTLKDRNGVKFGQSAIYNCGDASIGGGVATKTIDAANGVFSNGSIANRYIVTYTVPLTSTNLNIIGWDNIGINGLIALNTERGRVSVFMRCKQTTGAAGDVQIRFKISSRSGGGVDFFTGQWVNLPTFTSAYAFGLLYLGTITLPMNGKALSASDGRGLQVPLKTTTNSDLAINIDVKNNNAAARNSQFLDLVLMTQDECLVALNQPAYSSGGFDYYVLDNTGYYNHGNPEDISLTGTGITPGGYPEIAGQSLTLVPRVNNRLYMLMTEGDYATNPTEVESINGLSGSNALRLNIVPRWSGIRDV